MNLKYFKIKFVCLCLILVFLFQSCTAYQKTPVSIETAEATNNKVLVIKTNNTKLNLKKIEKIDGIYYGNSVVKGKIIKVPLNESDIKTIRIMDKSTSAILSVGTIIIPVGIIVLISTINFAPDLNGFGEGL